METTLIEKILAHLFGHKYYINTIRVRGVQQYEATSSIHLSKSAALAHRTQIESTLSFSFVETISFRSRRHYVNK